MENKLTLLGNKSELPDHPDKAILEKIGNENSFFNYAVRFTCPEFSSICPITSAPDYAYIVIDYIPKYFLLESKSLKLFLGSFRNHGAFHEACTLLIGTRIAKEIEPSWLRIAAYWYARGGIPLDIFWQTSEQPKHVFVPALDVPMFRGRG